MADAPTPPSPAPAPAPAPAPTPPAPAQPAPAAATPLPPVSVPHHTEAMTSIAAQLNKFFPSGVISNGPPAQPIVIPGSPPAFQDPNTPPAAPVPPVPPVPPVEPAKPIEPAKPVEPKPPEPPKPAEAPEPKPGEKPTEAQLDATEKAMPLQAGTAFKLVRGENAELKAALAEKDAKLEELSKAPKVDDKEVADLREQLAGYEEQMAVIKIEGTKEFKNTVTKPLEAAKGGLSQLATKYQISEGDLQSALAESDPAKRSDRLSELSTNFNRLDTVRFDQLIVETERLEAQKAAMLGGASERYVQIQREREQQQMQAQANFQKDWQKALGSSLDKVKQDFAPIYGKTGDENYDAKLESAIQSVQKMDLNSVTNEDIATALYQKEVFPLVLTLVSTLYSQTEELNSTIDRLRGGTPPVGDGNPPPPPPATPPIPENASFLDVAKQKMTQMGIPG